VFTSMMVGPPTAAFLEENVIPCFTSSSKIRFSSCHWK